MRPEGAASTSDKVDPNNPLKPESDNSHKEIPSESTKEKESRWALLKRFKDFITDPKIRTAVMDLFKKNNSKGEKGFFWKIANFSTFALANGYNQLAKLWNNFKNKYIANDKESLSSRLTTVTNKIAQYEKLMNDTEDEDEKKRIEITLNRLTDERKSIEALIADSNNTSVKRLKSIINNDKAKESTDEVSPDDINAFNADMMGGKREINGSQSYFKNFYRMRMLEV